MTAFIGRREFNKLLGGAVAWPLVARAEPADRMRRIGVLMGVAENDPEGQAGVAAFQQGLADLNWADGRNVRIEYRWAAGDVDRIRAYTRELVALAPDVLVGNGTPALRALRDATHSIPIVFVLVNDPVGQGFIANLARPGGNITGFTIFEHAFAGKWLEMLKEVVPGIIRVAVLQNPDHPAWNSYLRAIGAVASGMGVEVTAAPVNTAADIQAAIPAFALVPNGGLILLPSPVATAHRELIASVALRRGLPSIYLSRIYPMSGGLMSYGINLIEPYRQAAVYVDRILRGEKPADLPVQAPTKYELVVNVRTAKALGLEIPPSLLARADEVIE